MGILQIFTLLGALGMFLYGMNLMSSGLQKAAGDKLRSFLSAMTSNPAKGVLTGLGVTTVIQSSSATTVMVVSFVNAGTMTLAHAVSVIMGSNVRTTVTSWLTGLSGIGEGGEAAVSFLQWFKPSSFVPVLALIGVLLYMFGKGERKKALG